MKEQNELLPKVSEVSGEGKAQAEDRSIVTPYAFGVADHLLGTSLATPIQRMIAIGIDITLVGLLTYFNDFFFPLAMAWFCLKLSNRPRFKENKRTRRKVLRGVGYFFASVFVLNTFGTLIENPEAFSVDNLLSIPQTIPQKVQDELSKAEGQKEEELTEEEIQVVQSQEQQNATKQLEEQLREQLAKQLGEQGANEDITIRLGGDGERDAEGDRESDDENTEGKANQPPSLLSWLQGILTDLGISFGWAAAYYSFTTAWYSGQTMGKRFVGIKVIKLDGSNLTLWESFGRYGGYGAGLATGLLGFIQIFWDANRQSIQDKISETLVVKSC